MGKKRLAIAAVVVLVAGIAANIWCVFDCPPPRLVLKYGLPPAGGPTGRTWTNSLGMEFVEVSPGYVWVEGEAYRSADCRYWATLRRPVWICRTWEQWPATAQALSGQEGIDAWGEAFRETGDRQGKLALLERLGEELVGTYRLATVEEWDYSIMTGAITPDPDGLEHGQARSGAPFELVSLEHPDYRPHPEQVFGVRFNYVACRFVWVPPRSR